MRFTLALALLGASLNGAALLIEGPRLIVDARKPAIENAALLVENGRVTKVGVKGSVKAPAGAQHVDLTGRTIMPALIDAHIHVGYQKDLTYSPDNFTRENLIDQLERFARSGVAAVLSLGTDLGDLPFQIRSEQATGRVGGALLRTAGRGFAAPNAGPNAPELKPSAIGVSTEAEAREAVRGQIAKKVDFIKIWVDDRGGTVQKLSPALYRAIIDEAHKHRTRVMAHVFYLDDAKDLLRAGVDGFAHLARDREMDDEVVAMIKQRNTFITPNLTIGENATRTEAPDWVDDPLLRVTAGPALIARIRASYTGRAADTVERARNAYRMQLRSLAKLNAAGARIGFGTDNGAVRDFVYTQHRELQHFVDAGMTPAQALTAATATSAAFLGLTQLGTLEPGKSADFIVLEGNPLTDIANTRKIVKVYRRGEELR